MTGQQPPHPPAIYLVIEPDPEDAQTQARLHELYKLTHAGRKTGGH